MYKPPGYVKCDGYRKKDDTANMIENKNNH